MKRPIRSLAVGVAGLALLLTSVAPAQAAPARLEGRVLQPRPTVSGATAGTAWEHFDFRCEGGVGWNELTFVNRTSQPGEAKYAVTGVVQAPTSYETLQVPAGGTASTVMSYLERGTLRVWDASDPALTWSQLLHSPDCADGLPFTDVELDTQFMAEMDWMHYAQISTGYEEPNGTVTYRPLNSVNRDAMAAFLYRLAGDENFEPTGQTFVDVTPTTKFYKEIEWLASTGISTGWDLPDGKKEFKPLTPIGRDAMAAFLYRLGLALGYGYDWQAPAQSPFADLKPSDRFYSEMTWMQAYGISSGWEGPPGVYSYRPLNPVARDAMAAFMFRWFDVHTEPALS